MSKDSEQVLSCVGLIGLWILTVIISSVAQGFTVAMLWQWFVVPVFGLPTISIVVALGLGLIFSVYKGVQKAPTKDSEEYGLQKWLTSLLGQLGGYDFVLLFGFILNLFMPH